MANKEIRNPNDRNRLVCKVDETNHAVEIYEKGWLTRIEFSDDTPVFVSHQRKD